MSELTRNLGNFTNNFKPKINDIHQNNNSNYSYQNTNANHISSVNVEEMDLYKDGMMCAVKIGNTSSKLCYAVDQSLTALKLYKKNIWNRR